MLPCQHASNVKGLVRKSQSEGHGWIMVSHATPSAASPPLSLYWKKQIRCQGECFYGDSSQHKASLCFSSLLTTSLSNKSSLNHCLLTCLTYLSHPPNKARRSFSDVAENLSFTSWQRGRKLDLMMQKLATLCLVNLNQRRRVRLPRGAFCRTPTTMRAQSTCHPVSSSSSTLHLIFKHKLFLRQYGGLNIYLMPPRSGAETQVFIVVGQSARL